MQTSNCIPVEKMLAHATLKVCFLHGKVANQRKEAVKDIVLVAGPLRFSAGRQCFCKLNTPGPAGGGQSRPTQARL